MRVLPSPPKQFLFFYFSFMGPECPTHRMLDEVQARMKNVISRLTDTNAELANTLSRIMGDCLSDCKLNECDRRGGCCTECPEVALSECAPAISRIMHLIELLEIVSTQLEKNVNRADQI